MNSKVATLPFPKQFFEKMQPNIFFLVAPSDFLSDSNKLKIVKNKVCLALILLILHYENGRISHNYLQLAGKS